jgi:hypothetical protein
MRIAVALRETHAAESELAAALLRVGERHKADHDVFRLTRTLSAWSDRHVRALTEAAARFDADLTPDPGADEHDRGQAGRLEPGLQLLRDLRELHLAAARASLAWTMLGQGAQAIRDAELLDTVTRCHPETVRTLKWTVQTVKESSPQVLAS